MLSKTTLLALLSSASSVLAVSPVGDGSWTPTNISFDTQQCAGGSVSGNDFVLPSSPNGSTSGSGCSNGHLRAERRYENDYTSGIHQFGGTFTINSFGGDRVAIKQTFNGDTGPYFILAVESTGELYSVEGGAQIAGAGTANVGTEVTINTVHDADAMTYEVYVNGALSYTDDNPPGGSFYDKCGAYTTDSGTGPIDITWSDVQFWTQ